MVKTCAIRLRRVQGRDACDQIGFCAFHSFLVDVQMNAGYIHVMHVKYQPGDYDCNYFQLITSVSII